MHLVFGKLLKHRQLICFLKSSQANSHSSCFRGNNNHRRMRPKCSGNTGDTITNTGTVLAYANTLLSADTRITVGHMRGTLFVYNRNKTNAGGFKNIHGIHERGAHNAENFFNTMHSHRFYKSLTWSHARHIFFLLLINFESMRQFGSFGLA